MFPASDADGDHGMGVTRRTNRAGGIEGGMTNGAPVVLHVAMKPLPTLMRPLATVDLSSGEAATAHAERSDTCAIAAAAVALECAAAFELARVLREQYGSQALVDVLDAYSRYCDRVRYPHREPVALA
jgi:chorismate synthase